MRRAGLALVVCLAPVPLLAQPLPPPQGNRVFGGFYVVVGGPTGYFGQVVGSEAAGGLGGHFRPHDHQRYLPFRRGPGRDGAPRLLPALRSRHVSIGRYGWIDVGVRYLANRTVNWLAEGDVVQDASGHLQARPRHSPVNLVEITLGWTFGP